MVMKALRDSASHPIMRIGLFGLLLLATGGLALTGGFGFFSGGVGFSMGGNEVAKVGGESISLPAFDRTLRRSLARINIQPKEAYKLGYVTQVLSGEIQSRLMAQAAKDDGIVLSRHLVAQQIEKMIQPMVKDGQKEEDVLKYVLMNQGMSEAELVNAIGRDMSGSLLAGTIQNGFSGLSDDMLKDLYASQNAKLDAQYIVFMDNAVTDIPKPSNDDLKKLYDATKENYAIPETRVLQIIKVKDDNLKKTLQISDAELKKNYDDNKESYAAPASHTVDQSLFDSQEQAQKVYTAGKAGTPMDKAVKDVTGQTVAFLGSIDMDDSKLEDDLKKPIMESKQGQIIGPIKTALGWEVLAVKKISTASVKPFDSVKEDIRKDLMATKLSDAEYALANQVDDLLASGAKLDDVAKQVDVTITEVGPIIQYGQGADGKDAMKIFDKNAPPLLASAFKLQQDETSPVSQMPDGSFMAVHVKKLNAKTYKPFDDVKDQLSKDWVKDQAQMQNKTRVAGYLEDIKNGKKTLKDIAQAHNIAIQNINSIGRTEEPPKPLTKIAVTNLFATTPGQAIFIEADGGAGIAIPNAIKPPQTINENDKAFQQFKDSYIKILRNEAMAIYLDAKNKRYHAVVNEGLLDKTYGQAAADPTAPN